MREEQHEIYFQNQKTGRRNEELGKAREKWLELWKIIPLVFCKSRVTDATVDWRYGSFLLSLHTIALKGSQFKKTYF